VLRVVCVMSRELSLGFSLTGVEVFPVEDPARALQAVQEFVAGRDREELLDSSVPLVVPLPGELAWRDVEELPPDDYVAELIRRAVGYQLNVQL
jgi:vacuolar-type H+-ATPase subunit F/Vma7